MNRVAWLFRRERRLPVVFMAFFLAITSAVASAARPATVAADASCTMWAAPPADGGSDSNSGTDPAHPKANPILMLSALGDGGVGCLKDGAVFNLGPGDAITSAGGTSALPKMLRPETPGARATINASTGFWFKMASHDIILRDLDLRRDTNTGGSLLLLDGDRLVLDGVDATYAYNICLDIGGDPRNGAVDSSDDIVIRNSRIHDCGSQYGPPHAQNDSGVHGIYVQFTRRLLIENNFIYRNHNRGIQLYPDADNTIIRHNVLHANGANLNFGSERDLSIYSEHNIAQDNILTDSVMTGLQPGGFVGDTSEVLGNFPAPGAGVPDFDNHFDRNCVSNRTYPAELYEGYGFTHVNNIENQDPLYKDAANGDFGLQWGSPCVGKGPILGFGAPLTDNYKRCFDGANWNGDPGWTLRRKDTWLQLGNAIGVAGTTFQPATLPAPGGHLFVGGDSLALTGSDGTSATLKADATSSSNIANFSYRVDSDAFGPLVQLVDPLALKTGWLELRLSVVRAGSTLASTIVRYRFEAAIYNAGPRGVNCPNDGPAGMAIEWFGPGGRWWLFNDVPTALNWETSAPTPRLLSVTRTGAGAGSVSSNPAGISCGAVCFAQFIDGEPVTLSATPNAGSYLAGWSGACTGAASCAVTMSAARSVTAQFATDSTAPTAGFALTLIRTGVGVPISGDIPILLRWSASDSGGAGIDHFDLQRSLNGGAFASIATLPSSVGSYSATVSPSGTVRYRLRAVDRALNVGSWVATPVLNPRLTQETAATYGGGTWRSASSPSWLGNAVGYSSTTDAFATLSLTNVRSIGFIGVRGTNLGQVRIFLDGSATPAATIDLGGSAANRVLFWQTTFSTAGNHSIKFVVVGTAGRPKIILDAVPSL